MMSDIKSTAVVKYSATKSPAPYCELELNTNINPPPAKWLQGRFGEKEPFVPGKSSTAAGREFNSFQIANNHLDYVGSVDAITDAENIKKLLKMPYSQSSVSMMVHRVGKTLLIDHFDVYKHVLMAQQQEWKWLREFIVNTLVESGAKQALIPTNQGHGRKDIEEKLMLSKFLYYSLAENLFATAENDDGTDASLKPTSSMVPDPLGTEETADLSHNNDYERNVLWKLEDIRMLVGTDMPIFGGGTHPCVSLKLRDMKKPINVLTGIDYWLDQLMCNVPEVVMCYHLNGIVQKYEVLKTEDLPNLPDCKFNPEIVRDVAQNILSFLKSNATKEGHTYWLFKGHDDDVVKLYDLTSICKEYMTDTTQANPFTLPVAVLMYRVARNLLQKIHSMSTTKAAATIYRLLNYCLELIDKNVCPQVAGSVNVLLATLYITCGRPPDNQEKTGTAGKDESATDDFGDTNFDDTFEADDWFAADDDPCPGKLPLAKPLNTDQDDGNYSSVSLKALTNMIENTVNDQQSTNQPSQTAGNDSRRMPNCTNLEDCCKAALEHIFEGLECVETYVSLSQRASAEEDDDLEAPKPADKSKPIPLRYEPLKRVESSAKLLPLAIRQPTAATSTLRSELSALLFVKAATAYYLLADCAHRLHHFGKALRYVNLGLLCYQSLNAFLDDNSQETKSSTLTQAKRQADALLPSVLVLCGDVHLSVIHHPPELMKKHRRDFNVQVYRDEKIAEKARRTLTEERINEYAWCMEIPDSLEQNLILSYKCYEAAGKLIKEAVVAVDGNAGSPKRGPKYHDGRGNSTDCLANLIIDSVVVTKRKGNIKNELGVYYMSVAQAITEKEKNKQNAMEKVEKYWTSSYAAFQEGMSLFRSVNDEANEALLLSNCGRLMRTCAYAFEDRKEHFGAQEKHYYLKAMEFYQKALEHVKRNDEIPFLGGLKCDAKFWEMITWDLSNAYFAYAEQVQERPPPRSPNSDEVEREIVDYMHKSLDLVELLERVNPAKREIFRIRSSTIHHKLAGLYYRLFLEKEASKDKKAKHYKSLAELHYSKAADGFREIVSENACEYIRVQLERVSLVERSIENAGSATKQKLIQEAVRLLFACQIAFISLSRKLSGNKSMTNGEAEEEIDLSTASASEHEDVSCLNVDEKDQRDGHRSNADPEERLFEECRKLSDLLQQRLQALCKLSLKLLSSKTGHKETVENEDVLRRWKEAYAGTLKTRPKDAKKLPGFMLNMLQQMSKNLT